MTRGRALLYLWLACIIWGAGFPVTKLALRDASPAAFAFGRFLLATVLVSPLLLRASRATWKRGAVLGFLLATGFIFQSTSLGMTAAGRVAFIGSLYLLIVPLLLYLLHRTPPDRWNLVGALLAITGITLLTRGASGSSFSQGDLLALVCAFTFAAHLVATGSFSGKTDSIWHLVAAQIATACLFTGLALPFLGEFTFTPTPRLFALMGYQALFTSLIALHLQLTAQRTVSASTTALVLMLQPPFAAVYAYILLGEEMSAMQWLGGAVILLGTQLPELMRRKATT